MRRLVLIAGLCAWSVPLLCAAQTVTGLSAADVARINEVTQVLQKAALDQDWTTFANCYTEDAVIFAPNAPAVTGRAGIRAWGEKLPRVTALEFENQKVEGRGDLAYVVGVYRMTMLPAGSAEAVKDTGRYVEIRRRQPDGRWLLAVDFSNSGLPAAAPPR